MTTNEKEPICVAMRGREPQAMAPKRTEYGKRVRKDYEAHKISEQRKNIQQLEPRTDGVTNTLTGVQKDNLIAEPIVLGWTRDEKGNIVDRHPVEVANAVTAAKRDNTQNYVIEQRGRGFNKGGRHDICPTISANSFECNNHVLERIDGENGYPTYQTEKGVKIKKVFREKVKTTIPPIPENYRIRKLTPRECFRLMGVSDADIDKIQAAGISKSQQYKMAGNSIVVNCLVAIFRQLFIGNFNKVVQTEIF